MSSIRNSIGRTFTTLAFATVVLLFPFTAAGQMETYQRVYPHSQEEVERAVHAVQSVSRGRLPILDGFVIPQGQPLESFTRGYYECTLQVLPGGSGQTIVRAAAKITAWYTDPEASRSGYRVLPSNGRLENDSLDRIDEALIDSSDAGASEIFSSSAKSAPAHPASGGISPSVSKPKPDVSATPTPTIKPVATESIDSIRLRREANEKKAAVLAAEQKNLEEILHNQARPTDLVIAKKAATPVYSKPVDGAQVLVSADAHDEFQMLGLEGAWVHVQISGASRGWMRRSQVNLPESYAGAAATGEVAGAPAGTQPFRVEKEEVSTFSGKWEPLKAKNVRVVWAAPNSSPSAITSAREKKTFAKEMFIKAYGEGNPAASPIEGVVVLFDSADGGQIAATMNTVKQLVDGSLSEGAFWTQCSLDPVDLFENSAKPSSKSATQRN